jgi:hypothetical protein
MHMVQVVLAVEGTKQTKCCSPSLTSYAQAACSGITLALACSEIYLAALAAIQSVAITVVVPAIAMAHIW